MCRTLHEHWCESRVNISLTGLELGHVEVEAVISAASEHTHSLYFELFPFFVPSKWRSTRRKRCGAARGQARLTSYENRAKPLFAAGVVDIGRICRLAP